MFTCKLQGAGAVVERLTAAVLTGAVFYATSYEHSVLCPPMASRKEQKEQARAARIAQEQHAAAKAQRTRRLQIFGGVIAIAVIVIVVAIVVSSGGSSTPEGRPHGLTDREGGAAARQLGQHAAQRDPAERHHARQSERQGDDAVLRGPRVPHLPGVHVDGLPDVRASTRSAPATSRSSIARCARPPVTARRRCEPATGAVQLAAGRRVRRRQAEQVLAVRRALLPPAGDRGHRLRRRRLLNGLAKQVPGPERARRGRPTAGPGAEGAGHRRRRTTPPRQRFRARRR